MILLGLTTGLKTENRGRFSVLFPYKRAGALSWRCYRHYRRTSYYCGTETYRCGGQPEGILLHQQCQQAYGYFFGNCFAVAFYNS